MAKREVEIEILGQSLCFKTELSREELKEILNYIKEKEKEVEKLKRLPVTKQALFMILQMAYEYVKIKKDCEELERFLKNKNEKLGEFLEQELINVGRAWTET